MEVKSLSATAAQAFLSCPARFAAENIAKAPQSSGSPAMLGTACHAALEFYVQKMIQDGAAPDYKTLLKLYDEAYWSVFANRERYDDGVEMMEKWWSRTPPEYWKDRTVLSTEKKEHFPVPTPYGDLPWTFIWDRCDRRANGDIEVIDYKSLMMPVKPEQLRNMIQPRVYALAAQIKYPEAPAIWVNYDLLRYDTVGAKFTRDMNIETWHFVKRVSKEALESDGTDERINPECRWCIRSSECETLDRHITAGGAMRIRDVTEAAERRAKLAWASKAIETQLADLDEYILDHCEENNILEFTADTVDVTIKMGSRRGIDSERAAQILGPEVMLRHGQLRMGVIDKLLKDPTIDKAKKAELRALIRKNPTEPKVETKPRSPMEEP